MRVTFAENGTRIELFLRDVLEVRLPESQISGYIWQLGEKSCPHLRLFDSIYVERGPAKYTGQGERSWFFTTAAIGECDLIFYLIRPWSKPSPEFALKVAVK
ncbi:MAG TPA: protease inhibitor I42 family protein [Methanocella sp.]|uniref:protease inhibitor I42 family protein n=1 Tax=Methanocella sp. TaxID=2052833 RepID=UPI002B74046F|nr:protease inhibitor I42 family protein [Methanocella sp.]HTY91305.1 protease inhibitor I42 family protein [Methanocella sp.]